jgi:hypothetical protein
MTSLENSILKIINNFNFSKSKSKWEVIGKLTELYLKTGNELNLEALHNEFTRKGAEIPILSAEYKVEEKYRAEIIELIKILINSPT